MCDAGHTLPPVHVTPLSMHLMESAGVLAHSTACALQTSPPGLLSRLTLWQLSCALHGDCFPSPRLFLDRQRQAPWMPLPAQYSPRSKQRCCKTASPLYSVKANVVA